MVLHCAMSVVVMMHECSRSESIASTASMHHAKSLGGHQHHRVGMMVGCSTGESLTKAASMHHDHKGDCTLQHYATLLALRPDLITSPWDLSLGEAPRGRGCLSLSPGEPARISFVCHP